MAIVKAGGLVPAVLSIVLVLLFVGMLVWIRPRVPRWLGHAVLESGAPSTGVMAGVVVLLFACAFVTDLIGIHALFGSFLAGIAMPSQGEFRHALRVRLEQYGSGVPG